MQSAVPIAEIDKAPLSISSRHFQQVPCHLFLGVDILRGQSTGSVSLAIWGPWIVTARRISITLKRDDRTKGVQKWQRLIGPNARP